MTDARISTTGAWRQRQGLSVTRVEDDAFIVNPSTDDIFHLNALGRALWSLLEQPRTLAELVTALADAFPDIPRAAIIADTEAFIEAITQRGLIEAAN
jgi:hypothetical protein